MATRADGKELAKESESIASERVAERSHWLLSIILPRNLFRLRQSPSPQPQTNQRRHTTEKPLYRYLSIQYKLALPDQHPIARLNLSRTFLGLLKIKL
jgi:hypothetical protein